MNCAQPVAITIQSEAETRKRERERERGAETCRCNISAVIIERDKFPSRLLLLCRRARKVICRSSFHPPYFSLSACLIVFISVIFFFFSFLFIRGAENVTGNNGANRNLTPTCARLSALTGCFFLSFCLSVASRKQVFTLPTDTSV